MVKVGIVGASGYTGAELIRILSNHPQVELTYLTANKYADRKVSTLYPHLTVCGELKFISYDQADVRNADIVFIALPHGTSMKVVPDLIDFDGKIIDLSGDFRLKEPAVYEKWYGFSHTATGLLNKAVYGLPELYKEEIRKANFIANPGCYPTSVLLGIAPLLKTGIISDETMVVNACSGVSGAGRELSLKSHFPECNESIEAYAIAEHKHTPEIEQEMGAILRKEVTITFVPQLVPVNRGILATVYAGLAEERKTSELIDLYQDYYKDSLFVKVLGEGVYPKTKHVMGSNYCFLAVKVDERTGKVIVISAIDNLIKGASGQAVQNMNLMCGFAEDQGLQSLALAP